MKLSNKQAIALLLVRTCERATIHAGTTKHDSSAMVWLNATTAKSLIKRGLLYYTENPRPALGITDDAMAWLNKGDRKHRLYKQLNPNYQHTPKIELREWRVS